MKYLKLIIIIVINIIIFCDSFTLYNLNIVKKTYKLPSSPIVCMNSNDISSNNKLADTKVSWRSPTGKSNELMRELLAGMVVGIATIPTSISYSTVIGINPIIGIWNSAILGLVVTIIGGAPGLIAGSAGVIALPMAKIVSTIGLPYMSLAVILSSLLQLLMGIFKFSKVLDIVTEPVIAGFLNSLGIFLIQAQLKIFRQNKLTWLPYTSLMPSIFTASLCFMIIKLLPLWKKDSLVPPSMVGLVTSSTIANVAKFPIKSLADTVGRSKFTGGLAALPVYTGFPNVPLNLNTLSLLLSTVIGSAVICVVETLLAERIACDMYRCKVDTVYEEDNADRSVVGLGLGNLLSAFFGGFGGCGLIPNTLLNGSSGGEGYASGYAYAISMAIAVVLFAPILGNMPMSALAGLMFTVAGNTIQWKESKHLLSNAINPQSRSSSNTTSFQSYADFLAMVVTTYVCYKYDMGLGVVLGVVTAKFPTIIQKITSFTKKNMNKPSLNVV